jgi:proton-dependent oligopeptide transporter, POT family
MAAQSRVTKLFKDFPSTFWVANSLELFERLAYYAQQVVMIIFLRNHLKFSEIDAGTLSSIFGGFVYLLPIFAGTFADKYGFRKAFSFAFFVMMLGYFLIGSVGSPLLSGIVRVIPLFWLLAILLVFTAIGESFIKPSVLGTIALSTTPETKSLGYAIYYMLVNVGGAIGPLIAYFFRERIGIESVYMVSATTCGLMFLGTLIFYKSPAAQVVSEQPSLRTKFKDMARVLVNGRFMVFLLIFSLYWIMFWQTFVIIPLYVTDFISKGAPFELIESVDAWAIIILQVIVNRMTGKLPPITAIVVGFGISTLTWFVIALHPTIWMIVAALVVWSIGEMTQAPRYYEYIADHAPKGQEALFQGYAFLPIAIAWFIGGTFGAWLYTTETKGLLVRSGETIQVLGQPTGIWLVLAAIGILATLLMLSYNSYISRKEKASVSR